MRYKRQALLHSHINVCHVTKIKAETLIRSKFINAVVKMLSVTTSQWPHTEIKAQWTSHILLRTRRHPKFIKVVWTNPLVIHLVICYVLTLMNYVECLVLCTVLTYFNYIECYFHWLNNFVLSWMICKTMNYFCYGRWFLAHWMIRTKLNDSCYVWSWSCKISVL